MKRRKFLKSALTLSGIAAATGLYAWQVEPFWLEFVTLKMPIKNLPDALVGKTLMQISDIHIGDTRESFVAQAFAEAQALQPDFVVYTGDFVSFKSADKVADLHTIFENMTKGKLGTLGILGNHDYGKNWSNAAMANEISDILTKKGINMLRNEQKTVHGLTFIGFDDVWGKNYDPKKAMQNHDAAQANVVLCHNPDVADKPVWGDYSGWILSGHTHGGQCKPPFLPPPVLPVKNKKYTAGRFDLSNDRTLYINRALGHIEQVRFNVRPEITVFKLEKG
jgi:predicted MPP superfamily phosphohydrolase